MKAEKHRKHNSFTGGFLKAAAVLMVLIAACVVLLDPFYHYHGPLPGLKAVLNEKEYQVVGTLRHFDYDAVLAGSSVVENNDNAWFDEGFGVRTVKAVRSYGCVADLCWFLDEAFAAQEVRRVFFNLDPTALIVPPETTFEATGCPMYLYDRNPLTDVQYLFNKTVLFEKIPYMIAQSLSGSYKESLSYNWSADKDFSRNGALSHYYRFKEVQPMKAEDYYEKELRGNIDLLVKEVAEHPDTQFVFFIPPYSVIWWDDVYRSGQRDAYLYCEQEVAAALLEYENVSVYDFQNETEIITNLDLYMDTVHFSPSVNGYMAQVMIDGENGRETAGAEAGQKLTKDNYRSVFDQTRRFSEEQVPVQVRELEEQDAFIYGE